MNKQAFIEEVAAYVKKYAALYGIRVYSPIIAQAILESAWGESELATNANNYFGMKWRANRCPTSSGHYIKVGSEQKPDGSYSSSVMKWFKFPDMEACVQGYFDFTNNANYAALKGVTDPETYLKAIKAAGYATSLNYVENLMNVIKRNELTKYDTEEKNMLKVCIDAGHGLLTPGKRCMKKIDPNETREWILNSRIAEKLEDLLKAYNCEVLRVDDPTGKTDVSLANRCKRSNAWGADVYISIHHNAGINGRSGGGTVVFYYSSKAERKKQAQALYNALIASTGLVGNRSSKVINKGYYVVKNTKAPAFLFENGFMDSKTDVPIILSEAHADKTAQALVAWLIESFGLTKADAAEGSASAPEASQEPAKLPYRVKITADSLNVRSGAGVANKIVGCFTANQKLLAANPDFYFPKGIYTISEVKNGWGKLKSGIGWISLKYTEKC